jgi:putative membrane protein
LSSTDSSAKPRSGDPGSALPTTLLAAVLALLALSGVHPADRFTWFLEVAPILIGVPILIATYRRFPLTPIAYVLIALHCVILLTGGHYTYAKVPLFDWVRDAFHFRRNHFDRLGHFAQGFVPAILAREILLRKTPLRAKGWLFFLALCVSLAISAFYELIEWWVAEATGSAADAFLGTQGDPWDTQWDMCWALIGSLTAQLSIGPWHRCQVEQRFSPAHSVAGA